MAATLRAGRFGAAVACAMIGCTLGLSLSTTAAMANAYAVFELG